MIVALDNPVECGIIYSGSVKHSPSLKQIMCKENRSLSLAAKVAEKSLHRFRHGAVLKRGGSVISVASNSLAHTSFGQRFRGEPGPATHHAEISAILGLGRGLTEGSTLYVARVGHSGSWKLSKPCSMCQRTLAFVGIKRVVYTTGPESWDSYKVNENHNE